MRKTLVIAEKADVGRKLANALGSPSRRNDGALEVIYKGSTYIVFWTIGHLLELEEPHEYNPILKKWNFNNLPILPDSFRYKPIKGKEKQLKLIKSLIAKREIEEIINAGDAGREGELIFGSIMEHLGNKKPVQRIWLVTMNAAGIRKAFDNPRPAADFGRLLNAGKCRQRADWTIGINATRSFTIKAGGLCNIGRIQTPTLMLLIQREKKIKAFISEDYWILEAVFMHPNGTYKGIWFDPGFKDQSTSTRIGNEEKAHKIEKALKNKTGEITNIKEELKSEKPPFLFSLSTLQQEANKLFGFTAAGTLTIAQSLYEKHGVLSYPRSDSQHLGNDQVQEVESILNNLKGLASPKLDLDKCKVERAGIRVFDSSKLTDHYALIPTGVLSKNLSPEEKQIFELVVRRFVAAFYSDYEYTISTTITQVDQESFKTTGKTVSQLGWKGVYGFKDRDKPIPAVKERDRVSIDNSDVLKKQTQPPPHYTEASLLADMENVARLISDPRLKRIMKETDGLGTPVTRSAIIEKLKRGKYITVKGKSLMPTEKAYFMEDIVGNEKIADPVFTAIFERELDEIAQGKGISVKEFMVKIFDYTRSIVERAQGMKIAPPPGAFSGSKREMTLIGTCPKCGGNIYDNSKSYFCENWSDKKNACNFTLWKSKISKFKKRFGKAPAKNQIKSLLLGKTVFLSGLKSNGKPFDAELELANSGEWGWGLEFCKR